MTYSHEVEHMCVVKKGPNHGPAPIPEEGKWVKAKEIVDISGLTHGIGWCAPQQGACKLTLNVKEGVIQEALVETIGCSGMTHSAAMASEILPGKTILEALNTDLVCDAINTAMRELFLQIVYGRTQSAFSEGGLMIGAGLEDLGKGLRSQVGTLYGTLAKGSRYLEMAEGYIKTIALDKNDEICGYEFVHLGKFMDEIKKGTDANEALKKVTGTYGRFTEGQDFLNDEIIYFKDYMELKEGHFWVFYDKNQMLTTSKIPEWISNSECRLLLSKNCRNTYQIALTSYNVIDIKLDEKIMMINGEPTSISFVNGEPITRLARLLKKFVDPETGYDYSDIVILSLKTEKDSILANTNKIAGIPITHEKSNSSVLFTTASKFKGLESRVVIIVDIDDSCFQNESKKRLFYVACSRATQRLALFINGDDSVIQKMADTINSKSRFASKGRIAMKTKANLLKL